jgi:hypothetical protein
MTVRNLPATALDDDAFVATMWDELPDVSLATTGTWVELTLSQFAVTDGQIARHQVHRAACALTAAGVVDPHVEVDEIERPGVLDDLRCARGMSLWHARRAFKGLLGRRSTATPR